MPTKELTALKAQEYDARLEVMALRRAVFEHGETAKTDALFAAEVRLEELSTARAAEEGKESAADRSLVIGKGLLGADTTRLEASAELRLAQVPTSLVHLFDREQRPLVEFKLKNHDKVKRRVMFLSFVDGYSALAVDSGEIGPGKDVVIRQMPTFFNERLDTLHELTRATVNVEVRDLDARTELHKTIPVWLLARTTAPLAIPDPANGTLVDMTPYLGAFVTPNDPDVMAFAREVARSHPDEQLVGYQGTEQAVTPQVEAIFTAMKKHGIVYVNSIIDFTAEGATTHQRVRLPRETLKDKQANCIDGALLFASLLEAISLNPAIVIIPGHAFVAWETWKQNGVWSGVWNYLETTMIGGKHTFAEACDRGDDTAELWELKAKKEGKPTMFRRWSLRDLRAQGITPRA